MKRVCDAFFSIPKVQKFEPQVSKDDQKIDVQVVCNVASEAWEVLINSPNDSVEIIVATKRYT